MVETLVAIGILSISILATYTAVQSSLQKSTIAKDEIIAFYLAQEAMEYVKNVRDENALDSLDGSTVDWLRGLSAQASDACYFGKTCTIDSANDAVANCASGAGTCPYLRQDATSGLVGYTAGWTQMPFRREVQIQSVVAGEEVRVIVTISWTSRGATRSFQVNEIIFNRQ